MLESITTTVKPSALFDNTELLALCDAYSGQLTECQTALAGATSWVESFTGRSLLTQTKQTVYSAWPEYGLELRGGPVASVTSVKALVDEVSTALVADTDYRFVSSLSPARLIKKTDAPTFDDEQDAITVVYVCGVATRADVEGLLVSAVERLTKHLFEHPGDAEPDFLRALKNYVRPLRVPNVNGIS